VYDHRLYCAVWRNNPHRGVTMGYYSDVKFVICGKSDHVAIFMTAMRLTLVQPAGESCWAELKTVVNKAGYTFVCFEDESTKWNIDYPDVKFFEAFYNAAEVFQIKDDDGKSLSGKFIRLGEEDDDTEQKCFGENSDELMHIGRTIHIDFDTTSEA
jgi:hypothetical protein